MKKEYSVPTINIYLPETDIITVSYTGFNETEEGVGDKITF